MAEVLEPIAFERKWYWPATRLYRKDTEKSTLLKSNFEKKVLSIYSSSTNLKKRILDLQSEVNSWQFFQRVPIKIDHELARLLVKHNPRFEDGNYILRLYERSKKVTFFGALSQTTLVYKEASSVSEYLKEFSFPFWADVENIRVINPDGHVWLVPKCFNINCPELMPGSHIFIPFKEQLDAKFEQLNAQLVQLSIDRIL